MIRPRPRQENARLVSWSGDDAWYVSVPGHPTNLDIVRKGSTVLAEGTGGGCLDTLSLPYHICLEDG